MSPTQSHAVPQGRETVPSRPTSLREGDVGLTAETGPQDANGRVAAGTAEQLLRVALLTKLAIDLDDPALARRAASPAARHARLLAGLTWPKPDSDEVRAVNRTGRTLEQLLAELYPASARLDAEPHVWVAREVSRPGGER